MPKRGPHLDDLSKDGPSPSDGASSEADPADPPSIEPPHIALWSRRTRMIWLLGGGAASWLLVFLAIRGLGRLLD